MDDIKNLYQSQLDEVQKEIDKANIRKAESGSYYTNFDILEQSRDKVQEKLDLINENINSMKK